MSVELCEEPQGQGQHGKRKRGGAAARRQSASATLAHSYDTGAASSSGVGSGSSSGSSSGASSSGSASSSHLFSAHRKVLESAADEQRHWEEVAAAAPFTPSQGQGYEFVYHAASAGLIPATSR